MFVTSGFPPNATDETSELPKSNNREYFRSFIKVWVERNQAKDQRQAKQNWLVVTPFATERGFSSIRIIGWIGRKGCEPGQSAASSDAIKNALHRLVIAGTMHQYFQRITRKPNCAIMAQFGKAIGKIKILGSDLVGFTQIRSDLVGLGFDWLRFGFVLVNFWPAKNQPLTTPTLAFIHFQDGFVW
jgi:hypothetical protein